jgi:Vitamin B12 dependent methionine synthase, activation domain
VEIVWPALEDALLERLRTATLHALGEGDAGAGSEVYEAVEELADLAAAVASPAGIFEVAPLTGVLPGGLLTPHGLICSPKLARFAVRCEDPRSVVFAAVTLGKSFDEELARERPLFERLVLDAAGSVLTEMAADTVEAEWKRGLKDRGLEAGMRVSPGYCDWDLEGQGVIFDALDAQQIGITLSSSFVMTPSKSLSSVAVVAWRVPALAPCAFCGREDCAWRRLPAAEVEEGP